MCKKLKLKPSNFRFGGFCLFPFEILCDIIKLIITNYDIFQDKAVIELTDEMNRPSPDAVFGRNSVLEALRSGRPADSLLVASGERNGSVGQIIALCRDRGVTVKEVSPAKLDHLAGGGNHQGVVLMCAAREYADVDDIFALAEQHGEAPFILLLDEVEDPHNLGAIIRTAEATGEHGIIIPKRRSASLTSAVAKSSSGALEYMPVARVSNLASTAEELKKRGVWLYGADMQGTDFKKQDFSGGVALIIGSEGRGISRLMREKCDFTVSIPMKGRVNSLNAAVAAGILMAEISSRR